MPKFKYTAINQQNKELTGIIDAKDEKEGRNELNVLGFSILSFEEYNEKEPKEPTKIETKKYKFEATNRNQKKVLGSIRSTDLQTAYDRLVDEYNFEVHAIYPLDASEEKIKKAQKIDIENLKLHYEETKRGKNKKRNAKGTKLAEFELIKKRLIHQVDQIIFSINEMLKKYPRVIKTNYKIPLKKELDKLDRLKTSNNLEYIEEMSRALLKNLIKSDIYIEDTKYIREQIDMQVQCQLLFDDLKKYTKDTIPFSIKLTKKIEQWQQTNIQDKEKPTITAKIINAMLQPIYERFYEDEKTLALQKTYKDLQRKIFIYAKIWLTRNQAEKKEAKMMLKELLTEKKKVQKSLMKRKIEKKLHLPNLRRPLKQMVEELQLFTGWLLTFYLIYYFLAGYAATKQINISIPWRWYLFDSLTFRYVFSAVFLIYISFSLKTMFFPKNILASFILFPSSVITILFIVFNL